MNFRYVKPWKDNATGTLYCIFFPYSPNYLVNSLSKLKDGGRELTTSTRNGMLLVSVTGSPERAPGLLGSVQVLFIGGFSVSEDKVIIMTENIIFLSFGIFFITAKL